jgi:hypothetical protein
MPHAASQIRQYVRTAVTPAILHLDETTAGD